MTTPPKPARRGLDFRTVAAVFVGLLAVGFALGVVVHRRYVAYPPVAAQHVPSDAFAVARFDLTHVMLYEPFRRSIFPLVDALPAATASGRRDRLARRGVEVAAQVREVVVAFGPGEHDWLVVVGGTLPKAAVDSILHDVLHDEGVSVLATALAFNLGGSDVSFAQAEDGAFLLASSVERLMAAQPAHAPRPELEQASGGVLLRRWLPESLSSLGASFRAGSSLAVEVRAQVRPGSDAGAAEAELRGWLRGFGAKAPHVARALATAPARRSAGEVTLDIALPREAVEELAASVADRVSRR